MIWTSDDERYVVLWILHGGAQFVSTNTSLGEGRQGEGVKVFQTLMQLATFFGASTPLLACFLRTLFVRYNGKHSLDQRIDGLAVCNLFLNANPPTWMGLKHSMHTKRCVRPR